MSISSDPEIMMGKPVFSGTRIGVDIILEKLANGETEDQILESYPQLSKESIREALHYASRAVKSDIVYPVTA